MCGDVPSEGFGLDALDPSALAGAIEVSVVGMKCLATCFFLLIGEREIRACS